MCEISVFAPFFAGVLAGGRPVSFVWGIVVPGIVFLLSFVITWALYRKFARRPHQ